MKYLFIFTLALTSFLSVNLESVEAVSWQNTLTSCNWTGCNTEPYFNVTVNTNKAIYAPGETIQLSSYMQALICSNSAAIYSLSASVLGDSTNLANLNIVNGGGSHYSSGSLIAPSTPGPHDVDLTSCHFGWGMQCSTASITIEVTGSVPPPPPPPPIFPTAIISGVSCQIADGDSDCVGTLNWFISGATNPNVYHNNGTTYSNNFEGINKLVTLDYGLNTIYARNGVDVYATTNLNVECENGLVWDSGVCSINVPTTPPPPAPVITITIAKDIIRSGEKADTKTVVTAPYAATCTLYGVSSSPIVFAHSGSQTNPTSAHNYTTRPLTSAQIVSVTCQPTPAINGVQSTTADKRINIVPTVQET